MNMNTLRHRRARGYGLLEIALGIGIAALLVAGAMVYFQTASTTRKQNDTMSEVAAIQNVVSALYSGQSSYNGLNETLVAQSGQMPSKFIKGTGLTNAFSGSVTVLSTNTDQNYSVTITNVTKTACNAMATQDLGTGIRKLTVGGTTVPSNPGTDPSRAMTPAEANAASTNGATMAWEFF